MEKDGYKLAYIREEANIVAVAGYRINTNLFMGKHLYIDDLVTAESQRSKGYGENLLSWLRELAISEGCSYLHLDSGTHRGRAHKFYFEQGFTIASYHFSEQLKV
jgi:GNAT superfamily N-acetyltransferase